MAVKSSPTWKTAIRILCIPCLLLSISCTNPATSPANVQETATVETPSFSLAGGTYDSARTVTISCATNGASFFYTLDGKDPTTSSLPYQSAGISISASATLKAIATKSGMKDSPVAKVVYTFKVMTPSIDLLSATYNDTQVAHLSCPTDGASLLYTTNGDDPTTKGFAYDNATGIPINTSTTIKAVARKSGFSDSAQVSSTITLKVATPSFSLSEASPLNGVQSLSLTSDTPQAEIRYTTDESIPSATSLLFDANAPITLDATKTVRAIALRAGFQNSSPAQATFTITVGGLTVKAVPQTLPSPSEFSLNPYPGTDLAKLPVQMDLAPILAIVPGVLKAGGTGYYSFKPIYGVRYSIHCWDSVTKPAGISLTASVKLGASFSGNPTVSIPNEGFSYTATSTEDVLITVQGDWSMSAGTYALFVEILPDYRWFIDGVPISDQTAAYYIIDLASASLARGDHVITCVATVAGADYSCSYRFCKN